MSLSDVTAHSILCCWTNKANNFLWVSVSGTWDLLLLFKVQVWVWSWWSSPPTKALLQTEWAQYWVLCSLPEFCPTCPQIFESPLHTEIRIKHILLMNDIIKWTASHFYGQMMLSPILNLNQTAELLIKISHDSQS